MQWIVSFCKVTIRPVFFLRDSLLFAVYVQENF